MAKEGFSKTQTKIAKFSISFVYAVDKKLGSRKNETYSYERIRYVLKLLQPRDYFDILESKKSSFIQIVMFVYHLVLEIFLFVFGII